MTNRDTEQTESGAPAFFVSMQDVILLARPLGAHTVRALKKHPQFPKQLMGTKGRSGQREIYSRAAVVAFFERVASGEITIDFNRFGRVEQQQASHAA